MIDVKKLQEEYELSKQANELSSGINIYKSALWQEKEYLKREGGRKYKVTNGRLIGLVNTRWSYAFDIESELHIADDSPVSIEINGVQKAKGTVLMCEDFQMIVLLDSNLGNHINSAQIAVEPWKLLEAIENRLNNKLLENNSVTKKLIKKGRELSTQEDIGKIEKGQEKVLRRIMTYPITIVWGPPGTGKTYTMSKAAIQFMEQGKSVLIVSHSNVSVDGVAKKIYEMLHDKNQYDALKNGEVLRYGYVRDEELNKNQFINSFLYTASNNPGLKQKIDELNIEFEKTRNTNGIVNPRLIEIKKEINLIRGKIREQEQNNIERAKIICTTVSKIVVDKLFEDKQYDVVMFDEVSMAYVAQVICASTFAKSHFVCVGDFMQLAPIAQSPAKKVLCEDFFSYLGISTMDGKIYYHPWLVMLDEQRRMHPKISKFVNGNVYHSFLKDHESVIKRTKSITGENPFKNMPINHIDLSGTYCACDKNSDNSRFNILSAIIAFSTAWAAEKNGKSASIITPYVAQTRLIRALEQDYRKKEKTNIRCATIHQFQGSESDVVLFDSVESYPSKSAGWLMSKNENNSLKRLINVAVTRARGKLITISNGYFWENEFAARGRQTHLFYKLLKYIDSEGNHVRHSKERTLEKLADSISNGTTINFYTEIKKYEETLIRDINNAKKKIYISIPNGKFETDTENIRKAIENRISTQIEIVAITGNKTNMPPEWGKLFVQSDKSVFPLIIIDEKIMWYGAPQVQNKFELKNKSLVTVSDIVCRVKGKYTIEMVNSLANITYESETGQKPESEAGLGKWLSDRRKCPSCNHNMKMSRGKSGKWIMYCADCRKTELITPEEINDYIGINGISCNKCGARLKAGVGRNGLYVRCDRGDFIDLGKM